MDRETLLRLTQQAAQTIAEYNERIARQREVVERLRSGGAPNALLEAQHTLEKLIEEQAGSEAALIRFQAQLMFTDPHN